MKKMLIAASALGAAIAGIILYSQKKGSVTSKPSLNGSSNLAGEIEHRSQHVMG
jgi:hypothetical protein